MELAFRTHWDAEESPYGVVGKHDECSVEDAEEGNQATGHARRRVNGAAQHPADSESDERTENGVQKEGRCEDGDWGEQYREGYSNHETKNGSADNAATRCPRGFDHAIQPSSLPKASAAPGLYGLKDRQPGKGWGQSLIRDSV